MGIVGKEEGGKGGKGGCGVGVGTSEGQER